MNYLLKVISFVGLILTVTPSFLVYNDVITLELHKNFALVGTFLWIGTAPFWMKIKKN